MDAGDLERYRYLFGMLAGGVPAFLILVGCGLPVWRRGFDRGRSKDGRTSALTWQLRTVALALLIAVLVAAVGTLYLRVMESAALIGADFWTGVMEGVLLLGVVCAGAVLILLFSARKIIMRLRSTTAKDPDPGPSARPAPGSQSVDSQPS